MSAKQLWYEPYGKCQSIIVWRDRKTGKEYKERCQHAAFYESTDRLVGTKLLVCYVHKNPEDERLTAADPIERPDCLTDDAPKTAKLKKPNKTGT